MSLSMEMISKFPQPRHTDMVIKVCGMREPSNIRDVASLHPMLMGFIFHPASPRDASDLDPAVVKSLPEFIKPVGVFVDRPVGEVAATARRYGIGRVQLHGSESPEECSRLRGLGFKVYKAIAVGDDIDWPLLRRYEGAVDLFVFDKKTPAGGGSGEKFDWSLLDGYGLGVPYLLGGGIGPGDVAAIVGAMRPGMAGIDINSRFESAPGVKDLQRLVKFILSLRIYNEDESYNQTI